MQGGKGVSVGIVEVPRENTSVGAVTDNQGTEFFGLRLARFGLVRAPSMMSKPSSSADCSRAGGGRVGIENRDSACFQAAQQSA